MTVKQSTFVDDKIVKIKAEAYYKMLVHVLRFGNKARDRRQYKEVMGMLIGRLDGEANKMGVKNIIIEEAVPISHGGSIEVAFKPEDYISFSYVDAEYAERDPPLFTVGWYHSHPSLRIFFSSTDIKNQLGWQTPNPSAIGIVFDHTYLENPGDMGFRTFRLDDPAKGPMTDYHEVKSIVEPPDSTDYYIRIMEIINSIHSKEPPILEINETPDLFGDISVPGQSQLMAKQPELEITDIMEGLQLGISKFLELAFEPIVRFLNTWSQDIIKKVVDNNLEMRKDLVALKDSISFGMSEIQTTVKSSVTNKLYDLDAYIDDKLEVFDKDQEQIKGALAQLKENLSVQIKQLFEEKIDVSIAKIVKAFEILGSSAAKISEKSATVSESLIPQQNSLNEIINKIDPVTNETLEKVKAIQTKVSSTVNEKIENFSKEVAEVNKQLKNNVDDFDTAVSIIESSKQSLQKKIQDLENKAKQGGA